MYDAVVLGLGGVGSFALRALAQQGRGGRFLGLEQGRLLGSTIVDGWSTTTTQNPMTTTTSVSNHTLPVRGSSQGRTRIYRRAYFEHANYVPWIEHSLKVFQELQTMTNKHHGELYRECGMILVSPETSTGDLPPTLQSSYHSAQTHGIEVQVWNQQDLDERLPQLSYTKNTNFVGVFEPAAGFLRPERILRAAMDQAMAASEVTVLSHARVIGKLESVPRTKEQPSHVVLTIRYPKDPNNNNNNNTLVETNEEDWTTETIATRKLVIAAGAWTGQLVPSWKSLLTPTRQIQGWIDVDHPYGTDMSTLPNDHKGLDPSLYMADAFPAWLLERPDWEIPLYGLPFDDEADEMEARHWIKVAAHGRPCPIMDPSCHIQHPYHATEQELTELQQVAQKALARSIEVPFQFVDTMPCLYTMTRDHHYCIGRVQPHVYAVAGLSGHGFKMTPALGQMLCDVALSDIQDERMDEWLDEQWHTGFCSPQRFWQK